ncbi:unnamed protein product [Moneuplotes crassus]|uniref:Cyclic nucleotide-binding domain-containing protein n=1 Tax=Euplotes crassus TaxID=5936 RepID=A0AAD1UDJ6_EUPCR|nr:unnamed protein product [Moneuplotes crassus]
MLLKVIKEEQFEKDQSVITFGEFGSKFYIILQGSVAVRIPLLMKKEYSFKEMLEYFVEHQNWLIKDDKYQLLLAIIQDFIPEIIKYNGKGQLCLNFDLCSKVISGEIIVNSQSRYKNFFPEFHNFRKYSKFMSESGKMKVEFNTMFHVATLDAGKSFGELALINNVRRSATIVTLEDSSFAVIKKKDFDKVYGRVIKKKFATKVEFLNKFLFLRYVTRQRKEKLCFSLKRETFQIGQKICIEGTPIKDFFFIEKGEFEVTKYIFLHNKTNLVYYEYLRFCCHNRDKVFLKKLINDDTRILYSPNNKEFDIFKVVRKGLPRKTIRVSSLGTNECFGLLEGYTNCPYSLFTITCKSRDAVLHRISRDEMSIRLDVKAIPTVRTSVQDKLLLIAQRMRTTTKEHGINIQYELSDLEFRHIEVPPEKKYTLPEESESDDDETPTKDNEDDLNNQRNLDKSSLLLDYSSLRNSFQNKGNKKVIVNQKSPKKIVTDNTIQQHIELSRHTGTPSSYRRQKRVRRATFSLPRNIQGKDTNNAGELSKFIKHPLNSHCNKDKSVHLSSQDSHSENESKDRVKEIDTAVIDNTLNKTKHPVGTLQIVKNELLKAKNTRRSSFAIDRNSLQNEFIKASIDSQEKLSSSSQSSSEAQNKSQKLDVIYDPQFDEKDEKEELKDNVLSYKKKIEQLGLNSHPKPSHLPQKSSNDKEVKYKHLKQMNYQAKLEQKSLPKFLQRQKKPLKTRSPQKGVKLPTIRNRSKNWKDLSNSKREKPYNFGLSRTHASMPIINPKLKKMYTKDTQNLRCPLGGILDTFEEVKSSNIGALPKTVKDPRYVQIKKALDLVSKKSMNFKPKAKLSKYRNRVHTNRAKEIRQFKNCTASSKNYISYNQTHNTAKVSGSSKSPMPLNGRIQLEVKTSLAHHNMPLFK